MTTEVCTRAVETRAVGRALSNAAATAGQIPSIHNTQPWRWRLTDDELDLCLYHDRSIEATDPDSRLAVLSCGAALHHAVESVGAGLLLLRPDQIYDLGLGHRGDLPISETHDHAAAFGILYAAEDSRLGWLRAGEALSAAWLTATELGVSVLPLSVTIEVAVVREHMRRLLANLGYSQLVLRFSTSDPADNAAPRPPRLPTGQVIERPESPAAHASARAITVT